MTIHVTNADDVPVRKFGEDIAPGETAHVDNEVVIAYSLMEISLGIAILAKRAGQENLRREVEHHAWKQDRERRPPAQVWAKPSFPRRLWATITRKKPRWKLFG